MNVVKMNSFIDIDHISSYLINNTNRSNTSFIDDISNINNIYSLVETQWNQ